MPIGLKTGLYAIVALGLYFLYRHFGGGAGIGETAGRGIGSGLSGFGLGISSGFQQGIAPLTQAFDWFGGQTPRAGTGNTPGNARRGAPTVFEPDTASGRIYSARLPWLDQNVYLGKEAYDYYRDTGVI